MCIYFLRNPGTALISMRHAYHVAYVGAVEDPYGISFILVVMNSYRQNLGLRITTILLTHVYNYLYNNLISSKLSLSFIQSPSRI